MDGSAPSPPSTPWLGLLAPRGLTLLLAAAIVTSACQRRTDDEQKSAAPPPEALPPAAKPAPRPWYVGAWQARLEWTSGAPRSGAGLPREWLEETGPLDAADLTLRVDEARNVDGKLTGSFSLSVRGSLEDDTLRAELAPSSHATSEPADQVFRGTLVATRAEPEAPVVLLGTVRLSSGDSLLVRHAKVSLERASESPSATSP